MADTKPLAATHVARLIGLLSERLIAAEADLNALDRAIGDGDHGHNLSRAARSLQETAPELAEMPLGEMLARAGKAIVMSVGGASGPLYGTLLLEMGKALPQEPDGPDWAVAFSAGVAGVARRGRSAEGDKTMLDVLAPAARALEAHASEPMPVVLEAMRVAAQEGFAAQRGLRAQRGRAAYVGERSVGHDDPGAFSSLLCLSTLAEGLAEYGS